jgi:hypothetical protein
VRHGHISKQGSAWLRWILCEAAQTAKRHPDFAAGYQRTAHRRGKKIATTAIARKLLTRAYHLLMDAEAQAGAAPGPNRKNSKTRSRTPSRSTGQQPATTSTARATSPRRTHPRTGTVTQPRASSQTRMSRPSGRARCPDR